MRDFSTFDHILIKVVGVVGAIFLSIVRSTLKITIIYPSTYRFETDNEPKIAAFWHSQVLMMPWLYFRVKHLTPKKDHYVLISSSRDGQFITNVVKYFKLKAIAGSSSLGGREALLRLVRLSKQGHDVSITPDGPKGPTNKVKLGVIMLASLSGSIILPIASQASKKWEFNSWDKMFLPKPFAKLVYCIGEPIRIEKNADDEYQARMASDLELTLTKLTELAQQEALLSQPAKK